MRDHGRIHFRTGDRNAEETFLRAYVLDAVGRLPDTPACDMFVFVRAGHDPNVEGGLVIVDVYGDPDEVVERERDDWDELVEDGPLAEWNREDVDVPGRLAEAFEDVERHERLRYLACRMTAAAFDVVVDDRPAPVGSAGEDTDPVGWHRVLHLLSNNWGYTLEEELDANVENVRTLLRATAASDPETAHDRLDETLSTLESTREEFDDGE